MAINSRRSVMDDYIFGGWSAENKQGLKSYQRNEG